LLHWRALSPARQAVVLRHWLQEQGVAMPGERRLADLLRQLRQLHALGHDRELLWQHGAVAVRCKQGRVMLSPG
jgi:tRNA(Ile)-lysidine synthase